jgi:hypothetical protein
MHFINRVRDLQQGVVRLCLGPLGLAAALCMTACGSKELTRSRAADVLKSSEGFQKSVTVALLPAYRQSLTLIGTGSHTTPKDEFALRRFLESRADLATLNHLGLVEFRVVRIEYPDSASSPVTVTATLTDEGRSASREWEQSGSSWLIPIARRALIEVTGLKSGGGDSKTARVEYTWKWEPTATGRSFDVSSREHGSLPESIRRSFGGASFADMLRDKGQLTLFDSSKALTGAATLQLYDDGWRLTGGAADPPKP